MGRSGRLLGALCAGGLLLAAARAEAYVVGTDGNGHELKWASPNVTYRVNTASGPTGALTGIQAAFSTWTDVSTSSIAFLYGGTTAKTSADYGKLDGENIVVFGPMTNVNIVAQNSFFYYTTGEVIESDIIYNTQQAWATDGSAGKFDVWNVGAHELGHALVLSDLYAAGDAAKTMYGYSSAGETKKRDLDPDDIAGAFHLYPELNPTPGAFSKSAPANGASGQAPGPTLSWAASTGATSYEYCYDTTSDGACGNSWVSTGGATSVALAGLTPGATYSWQVRAVNANGPTYANAGAWWSFTVAPLPGAFAKSSPLDTASGQATVPTLQWGASSSAAAYEYCYDTTDDDLCGGFWNSPGNVTSVAVGPLAPGQTYFWQVRAVNATGTTYANAGAWWSFTVLPVPGPFAKSAPANGASGPANGQTLQWGASSNAVSYAYCVDTTNDNACSGGWTANGVATSVVLGGLATGTTYYWQVRAANWSGEAIADGGTWWSFTTVAPPGSFAKSGPANVATGVATDPTLSWGASAGATSYEYCYDTTNDAVCGGTWTGTGAATNASLSGLAFGTTYYWQVRATGVGGTTTADGGAWWRFTTVVGPPGAFGKAAPAAAATGVSLSPTLQWEASDGATAYEYCCDTTDDGACGGSWTAAGTATSVAIGPLAAGTAYFWQVRATNAGGTTAADGGVWRSFTTVAGGQGWTFAWDDLFGGAAGADDAGYDVAVDAAGNAYVVGSTWVDGFERENVLLRAYAPDGTVLLDVTYDGGNWAQDVGRGVAVDPGDGSIYVAGWTSTYLQGKNVLLLKYSAAGALLWARTYDGWSGSQDLGFGVALDADGNVYVAGTTVVTGRSYDVFLRKCASDGEALWTQVFDGGGKGVDVAYRVRVAGDLVLAAGATQVAGHGYDAALWAFGRDGVFQGYRSFDGEDHGDDFGYGLDVSSGMILLGGATTVAGRGLDTLGLVYDLDGTLTGRLAFAGDTTGDDVALGIAYSPVDATVYVVGSGGNALPGTGRGIVIDGDRSAFLTGDYPAPGAGRNLFTRRYEYLAPP
jgi:hypothetical protein